MRLKGGDPYLFGRGAEEATYLAQHGIACEVIPGITAGIAAPMAAGIPVTHRKIASTVTFVTGHEDPTKPDTAVDYKALAQLHRGRWHGLLLHGRRPLAADRRITCHGWPRCANTCRGRAMGHHTAPAQRAAPALHALPDAVKRTEIGAPAIVVVGQVAGLEEPGLNYFTQRPLFGQTILITRMRQQASELGRQLQSLGAEVIEAPTIALVPPCSWDEVDQTLREVKQYDWLLLTSANSVNTLADRLDALQLDGASSGGREGRSGG